MTKPIIPAAALNAHATILGTTGSGKSYTARGMVERLLAAEPKARICIIDPKGDWYGIRAGADGKGRGGLPITIIGGPRADEGLKIDPDNPLPWAKPVGDMIATTGAQIVLDLSDLDIGKMRKFVTQVLHTVYASNKAALWLVVDEADEFAPKSGIEDAQCLSAMQRIAKRGRGRGVRFWTVTQRPATLHNDVLGMAQTLVAMKMVLPHDRNAIDAWVEGQQADTEAGKSLKSTLPKLAQGEGWLWCPAADVLERVKFPKIHTYDSMRTPEIGDDKQIELPPIDTSKLVATLAKVTKEAEANDPKKLKERIAQLERELKAKPAAKQPATDSCGLSSKQLNDLLDQNSARIRRDLVRSIAVPLRDLDKAQQAMFKQLNALGTHSHGVGSAIAAIQDGLDSIERGQSSKPLPASETPVSHTRSHTPAPKREPRPTSNGSAPGTREQRFLDAAAALQTLNAEVTRETVSAWVGVHPRGGSVGEVLKSLADSGMIEMDRGRITVTAAGLAAANDVDPTAAIESAKSGLTNRQRQFFEAIVGAYPESITREAIAQRFELHPRGGSLGEDLGRLVGRGLVTNSRGAYTAREFLFAGGRS